MTGRQVHVEHVMGTAVSFDVRDALQADIAIDRSCRWLHQVDATYSTYREDSVISRIGQGLLQIDDVDLGIRGVLDRCESLSEQTGGAFDVYATGPLDPSGYVKGWAIERAAGILESHDLRNFMINAGGDMVVRGRPQPGHEWRVGIRHPSDGQAFATVAELRDCAIATSARYERGDHVPFTGSGTAPDSVSVVADDLGVADGWATAILAGGQPTLALAQRFPGIETFVIIGDDTLRTADFPLAI